MRVGIEAARLYATLDARDVGLSRKLRAAGAEMDALHGRAGRMGKGIAVALGVGGAATGAIELGTHIVKTGMAFDAQMSRVQALSGATGQAFNLLRGEAMKLGAQSVFTSTQAAEGMEKFAAAGMKPQAVLAAMPGLVDAAAVSGEGMAATATVMTTALGAFALKASAAAHVADVLAQSSNESQASVADMGESLKYAAPMAHTAGLRIEDLAGVLTIMAKSGIQASMAGTETAMALQRLASPPKKASAELKKLGIEVADAHGKFRPFSDIVGDLHDKFDGLSQVQRMQAATAIFGAQASRGMISVIAAGGPALAKFADEFTHADGAAKKMSTTMLDNLHGSLLNLTGSLELAEIKLYDTFKQPLRVKLDALNAYVQTQQFMDAAKGVVREVAHIGSEALQTGEFLYHHAHAVEAVAAAYVGWKVAMSGLATVETFAGAGKALGLLGSAAPAAARGAAAVGAETAAAAEGAGLLGGAMALVPFGPWGLAAAAAAAAAGGLYLALHDGRPDAQKAKDDLDGVADALERVKRNSDASGKPKLGPKRNADQALDDVSRNTIGAQHAENARKIVDLTQKAVLLESAYGEQRKRFDDDHTAALKSWDHALASGDASNERYLAGIAREGRTYQANLDGLRKIKREAQDARDATERMATWNRENAKYVGKAAESPKAAKVITDTEPLKVLEAAAGRANAALGKVGTATPSGHASAAVKTMAADVGASLNAGAAKGNAALAKVGSGGISGNAIGQVAALARRIEDLPQSKTIAIRAVISATKTGSAKVNSLLGFAGGGVIHGEGTGTSDSIIARVSNGEAIIPAKQVAAHPALVNALVDGNLPGYAHGRKPVKGKSAGKLIAGAAFDARTDVAALKVKHDAARALMDKLAAQERGTKAKPGPGQIMADEAAWLHSHAKWKGVTKKAKGARYSHGQLWSQHDKARRDADSKFRELERQRKDAARDFVDLGQQIVDGEKTLADAAEQAASKPLDDLRDRFDQEDAAADYAKAAGLTTADAVKAERQGHLDELQRDIAGGMFQGGDLADAQRMATSLLGELNQPADVSADQQALLDQARQQATDAMNNAAVSDAALAAWSGSGDIGRGGAYAGQAAGNVTVNVNSSSFHPGDPNTFLDIARVTGAAVTGMGRTANALNTNVMVVGA